VTIAGDFRWLECADVCVPASATLDLVLPVKPGAPEAGPSAALFAEARSQSPKDGSAYALTAEAGPRAISLGFRLPKGTRPRDPYFYPDQPLVVDHAAAQGLERDGDGYRLTMTPALNAPAPPNRLTGVLVFQDGGKAATAVRVDVAVAAGDPAPARRKGGVKPWMIAMYSAGVALLVVAWVSRSRRTTTKS
jgi:thiol:disulfide interchange protein DsbD